MSLNRHTVTRLVTVIVLIVLITAISVPPILAALRNANERNAAAGLRALASAEATFKKSDSEKNGINDYWILDVGGLHFLEPGGINSGAQPIKLIDISVALADGNTAGIGAGLWAAPASVPYVSSPKSEYWFQALASYELPNDTLNSYNIAQAGSPGYGRNVDHFGFIAYPNTYGSSGKLMFVINETGTMYKRDPLGQKSYLVGGVAPNRGAVTTSAVLTDRKYDVFPLEWATHSKGLPGPWTEMN